MQEWLNALKVGDEVLISKSSWRGWIEKIAKVERRTPTGRIVVDGVTFLPNGQKFRGWDGYASIEPVTEEVKQRVNEKIFYQNAMKVICNLADGKIELGIDELRQIVKIVENKQAKEQKEG